MDPPKPDPPNPSPTWKTGLPRPSSTRSPMLRIPEVADNIETPIVGIKCPNPSCRNVFDLNHPPLESSICPQCANTRYCSLECMRGDQAVHVEQVCQQLSIYRILNEGREKANITRGPLNTIINPSRKYALEVHISMPFCKLTDGKWLHARSETDVYKLLIDAYRWRVEEDQAAMRHFFSNLYDDPFHGGRDGFSQWIEFVEANPGTLPSWWTNESKTKAFEFAASSNDWSLDRIVTVEDMKGFYGPFHTMGLQMSIFSELMTGIPPGQVSTRALHSICLKKENEEALAYYKKAFN